MAVQKPIYKLTVAVTNCCKSSILVIKYLVSVLEPRKKIKYGIIKLLILMSVFLWKKTKVSTGKTVLNRWSIITIQLLKASLSHTNMIW